MKHNYKGRLNVKSTEEINKIEKACRIVADTLQLLEKYVVAGISTLELDSIAEDYIKSKNAIPAFKGFKSVVKLSFLSNNLSRTNEKLCFRRL